MLSLCCLAFPHSFKNYVISKIFIDFRVKKKKWLMKILSKNEIVGYV